MSFKVTLNSVDEHIKGMMLSCPALFPNRLAALKHLFMVNGNGYAWNENGELVGGNDQPPCGAMDYTDLYERQEKLARNIQSPPATPFLPSLTQPDKLLCGVTSPSASWLNRTLIFTPPSM